MAKDKQEKLLLMEAGELTLAEAVPGKDRAAQNKKAEYRKMLKPVSRVDGLRTVLLLVAWLCMLVS